MVKQDIWDKEFSPIVHIDKNKLKKWSKRYRMGVRFALGKVKTEKEFEKDKSRILSM